jgi:hypothetical protein
MQFIYYYNIISDFLTKIAFIFINRINFYSWMIKVSYNIVTCILLLDVLFNNTFSLSETFPLCSIINGIYITVQSNTNFY